jgi:hypothetical protein
MESANSNREYTNAIADFQLPIADWQNVMKQIKGFQVHFPNSSNRQSPIGNRQ